MRLDLAFVSIKIDDKVHTHFMKPEDFYGENIVEIEDGPSWASNFYFFKDDDSAGDYCVDWQRTIIEDDPDQAVEMIGAENLIQWALGNLAGPGSIKVRSLEEWFQLFRDHPLDGPFEEGPYEIVACSPEIEEHLGFKPTVAFAH